MPEMPVIPKPGKRNTTPEDFNIQPEYVGIPYDLVIDGKIMLEFIHSVLMNSICLPLRIVRLLRNIIRLPTSLFIF
mgnify:CR=1 FL=1